MNRKSECVNQCEWLEKLYLKYKKYGLIVLGFLSNEFEKEKEDEKPDYQEIKNWFEKNYNVTFPLFKTTRMTGQGMHLLWKYVSYSRLITSNFTKFLYSYRGNFRGRFEKNIS